MTSFYHNVVAIALCSMIVASVAEKPDDFLYKSQVVRKVEAIGIARREVAAGPKMLEIHADSSMAEVGSHPMTTRQTYFDQQNGHLAALAGHFNGSSAYLQLKQCEATTSSHRVAFVGERIHSWGTYQNGQGYLGGEAYWAAGIQHVLEKLGFSVDFYPDRHGRNVQSLRGLDQYHRIIVDGYPDEWFSKNDDPCILSRVRVLHWWGRYHGPYSENVLVPFASFDGNPVPILVHAQVLYSSTGASRGRKLFIFGKSCDYFLSSQALIRALANADFELHSSVAKCFPQSLPVKIHGVLHPPAFRKLLATMSAVVGFGDPKDSPTPLEGLAVGAAFLNAYTDAGNKAATSQHRPLTEVGEPYVYMYDIHDIPSLVAAAEKAVTNRFASFVPAAHQGDSVAAAVCNHVISQKQQAC